MNSTEQKEARGTFYCTSNEWSSTEYMDEYYREFEDKYYIVMVIFAQICSQYFHLFLVLLVIFVIVNHVLKSRNFSQSQCYAVKEVVHE